MATTEETLTPSPDVDEAWHLHLSYTRSYWDRLCTGVIGRPLHHDPTEGGTAQKEHFQVCYQRTLDRYRQVFGPTMPRAIWPDIGQRFDELEGFRTLRLRDHWFTRRLWSPQTGRFLSGCAVVGAMAGGAVMAALAFPTAAAAVPLGGIAAAAAMQTALVTIFGGPSAIVVSTLIEGDGGGCGGCGGCGG